MARILVADDEEGLRSYLAEALSTEGHDVAQAADGRQALSALRAEPFELLLLDLKMPGLHGMEVLAHARRERPELPVVVLTAHGTIAQAVEAMRLGAFDFLEKPLKSPGALRALARAAIRSAPRPGTHATPAGEASPQGSPRLSYGAPAMRSVLTEVEQVARTAATVLLQGESGTGKELLARAIHAGSPRAQGPFVAINCAALAEGLVESELFGHEKGAFTGAHERRKGKLELAEGGTFFLDEVAELQPTVQSKLLRVLQERSFERVGGGQTLQADVRWVAATHRDLKAMVARGAFREDLFYRLSVFPIHVPPLRARREDIVPLARALLTELSQGLGRPPDAARLSPGAEEKLLAYNWPGNVRQLRNVLERAAIVAGGGPVEPAHLVLEGNPGAGPAVEAAQRGAHASANPGADPGRSLEELEREAIRRALDAESGHRKRAAERLGIGLRTLYEKIKRYRL